MTRKLVTIAAALSLLLVGFSATEASARQCKRICMGGDCWYDCSKIPGQKNLFGI